MASCDATESWNRAADGLSVLAHAPTKLPTAHKRAKQIVAGEK